MSPAPWTPDATFWRERPVLLTGAGGFVGRHVGRRLHDAGARVVVLARRPDAVRDVVEGSVLVEGDVVDDEAVTRAVTDHDVRTVVHLAAQSQVPVANRDPAPTFDANIRGTWTVLDAARRAGTVEQVVTASSDKAYGSHDRMPLTEDAPLLAAHPYDASKACADIIARTYAASYALPVCTSRCGNVFGPGDTNWERLVPGTFRAVLGGEAPVIRSDGTMVRDFLSVEDVAPAMLRIVEALADDPGLAGEAFNLSTGRGVSVLEMVERVQRAAGTDLEPVVGSSTTNEIDVQELSADKARRLLGWTPHLDLDEALARTADWYRSHLGGSS